MIKYFIR